MAGIKDIIATQEKAAANFDKAVETSEKKIFDEVVLLIKDLETTPKGNIKTSISNLKRVQKIRTQLSKIANNKEYLKAVADLVGSFDKIYQQQLAFYAKKNQSTRSAEKKKLVQTIARENTIESLSGAGLATNVLDQLDNMLVKAVTTGAKFSDLQDELHAYLVTDSKSQGALAKYAKTYAVTALSQYAGQNNKLFTEDLGTEWFEYVGSEIETTRPLCNALIKKRYIHKSEIPEILKGHIHIEGGEDIDVEIYPKTKLPYGMIEGTNADNFQVNVGGWNCRHQLIPVADAAVPENIRAKFDKKTQEEFAKKKAEEEKKAKVIKDAEKVLQSMDGIPAADSLKVAISRGDVSLIEQETIKLKDIESQLNKLSHIVNAKEEAKKYTLEELQAVNKAVDDTLKKWMKKYSYDELDDNPKHAIAKLEQEIMSLVTSKKYSTWQVAQMAYQKKLAAVKDVLDQQTLVDNLTTLQGFKTNSKIYKGLLNDLEDAIASQDLIKAKAIKEQLIDKQAELINSKSSENDAIKKVTKHNPKSTNETPQSEHNLNDSRMRGSDGIDAIVDATGATREQAKDYLEAVIGFSWEWDYEIRQVQCGNNVKSKYGHTLESITKKAIDLEEFIAKSPRWMGRETYRGISLSPKEIAYTRAELKKGSYTMLGAASWSTAEHTAKSFAGRHIGDTSSSFGDKKTKKVVFIAKDHTKATSIRHLSEFPGENEVLASKQCKYKIVSERTEGDYLIFEIAPSN